MLVWLAKIYDRTWPRRNNPIFKIIFITKQLVFLHYPPSKLISWRIPLLRAVHYCRVYGIATQARVVLPRLNINASEICEPVHTFSTLYMKCNFFYRFTIIDSNSTREEKKIISFLQRMTMSKDAKKLKVVLKRKQLFEGGKIFH
jgi:hypothetical protein